MTTGSTCMAGCHRSHCFSAALTCAQMDTHLLQSASEFFFFFFLTCLFPDSLLTLALSHQDQLLDLILGPDLVWQSDYKSLCSHICEESKKKKKNTWEFDTFNQQINLKIKVIGMVTSIVIKSRESLSLHFTGTHMPCCDFNTGWCCGQLQDYKLLTCIKKLIFTVLEVSVHLSPVMTWWYY